MLCSICLDALQSPVVTPCGHVFCLDCLISSSQKSPNATKAPCPTCRTTFSLVSPDAIFIPEKYRQFIDSSVRRLYLDNAAEPALQERVAQLEARIKSLETQKDLLMNRCESYMTASIRHAKNEKDMRMRCSILQNELNQANQSVAELIDRDAQRIMVKRTLVEKRSTVPRPNLTDNVNSTKSTPSFVDLPLPNVKKRFPKVVPPEVDDRPVVPLPKRCRITRPKKPLPRAVAASTQGN